MSKTPTNSDKTALNHLSKQHKKLIRKVKRKYDKEFNAKLKTLKSNNSKEYWNIMNQNKKKVKMGNISLGTFQNFFRELSKNDTKTRETLPTNNHNTNETINEAFTKKEICKHITSLKNNRASGADNILNEFIKHCPEELIPAIVKLFNVILETGIIPSDWTIGIIKALYKNKGDINDVNNYRGITLLSCLGKLFTSVINSRLYTYLTNEGLLGNEQAGFRPKHSTLVHIFAL